MLYCQSSFIGGESWFSAAKRICVGHGVFAHLILFVLLSEWMDNWHNGQISAALPRQRPRAAPLSAVPATHLEKGAFVSAAFGAPVPVVRQGARGGTLLAGDDAQTHRLRRHGGGGHCMRSVTDGSAAAPADNDQRKMKQNKT